jgi:membrane-associated phospholipid phosphatase
MDNINKLFGYIGFFGPLILIISSITILIIKQNLLVYYLIGLGASLITNIILKLLIKDPRPKDDLPLFEAELAHDKRRILFDRYGMPSGHAQLMGFSLGYIMFAIKSHLITNIYLVLTIITLCQRFVYRNHTITQLLVGTVVGFGIGYYFYLIATKKIMGPTSPKPDDNAPFV